MKPRPSSYISDIGSLLDGSLQRFKTHNKLTGQDLSSSTFSRDAVMKTNVLAVREALLRLLEAVEFVNGAASRRYNSYIFKNRKGPDRLLHQM